MQYGLGNRCCLLIAGFAISLTLSATCHADLVFSDGYHASTASAGDFTAGPTTPGKWGSTELSTPGGIVTWSLATSDYPSETPSQPIVPLSAVMPDGFKEEIERAFASWSSVADITFVEVVDNGAAFNALDGNIGDIRIGGHTFDGAFGTLAHGYFPPINGGTAAGDIHFDVDETWKIGFGGPGFDIFQVMSHEIGHAIGLGHSLNSSALMSPVYTEAFYGIQQDDIDGAVALYGIARTTTAIPEPSSLVFLILCCVGRMAFRSVLSKQ